MNTLFTKHRWMQVMWGVLLVVAGVITILFSTIDNGANIEIALTVSIAVVLFAYGLTILFSSFLEIKNKFFSIELIFGTLIVAVAIVFCLSKDILKELIVRVVSSILLSFGAVFIIRAIIGTCKKGKTSGAIVKIVFNYIFGAIFLGAGVVAIVFQGVDQTVVICYIGLGAILILLGGVEMFMAVKNAIGTSRDVMVVNQEEKKVNNPKPVEKEVPTIETKPVVEEKPVEEPVIEAEISLVPEEEPKEDKAE